VRGSCLVRVRASGRNCGAACRIICLSFVFIVIELQSVFSVRCQTEKDGDLRMKYITWRIFLGCGEIVMDEADKK
jgi:hypothetical protein